jgi:hypothetical protein
MGCAKSSDRPVLFGLVSKFTQRKYDYQAELPVVTVSYLDDFRRHHSYDPLESILRGQMRIVNQKVDRATKACEILIILHDQVINFLMTL